MMGLSMSDPGPAEIAAAEENTAVKDTAGVLESADTCPAAAAQNPFVG